MAAAHGRVIQRAKGCAVPGTGPGLVPPCSAQHRDRGHGVLPLAREWSSQGIAPRSGGSALGFFLKQTNISRTLSPDPQREPGQQGMSGTWPGWQQLEGAAGITPGKQERSCF